MVLVKGPGWAPGKPRLGYIEDVPDVGLLSITISISLHFLLGQFYRLFYRCCHRRRHLDLPCTRAELALNAAHYFS